VFKFRLTIAYDGTTYHGWQVQPGVPTIQGELNEVLSRILDHPVQTHGSGRTDRGVHAEGQVAHFVSLRAIRPDTLQTALNALLAPDIRILDIRPVPADFDARRSAVSKTYEYHLWRASVVSPFRRRYVHSVRRSLDEAAIDRATEQFLGVHDFTSFCAHSTEVENRVREVFEAGWRRDADEWVFRIRANGFLRYMVRTIVGTLLDVGVGRTRWQQVDDIFAGRDRRLAGESAPASGLTLVSVEYSESARP